MTMKTLAAGLLLAGCIFTFPHTSSAQSGNGAESAYRQYIAAWKGKDIPALDALIADDYMTLNGQKKVAHKRDELDEARASPAYEAMEVNEIHSLLIGNTAVVSALLTVAGSEGGKPYKVQVRDLATFLNRGGRWQIIADQSAN